MEENELYRWLNSDQGGKTLKWSNQFLDIEDQQLDLQSTPGASSTQKKYKGHWKHDEAGSKTWEGFGTIEFADGSKY